MGKSPMVMKGVILFSPNSTFSVCWKILFLVGNDHKTRRSTLKKKHILTAVAALAIALTGSVSATTVYDTTLANGVIFGSGNSNDHFAVDTANNVEVGLRAKIPFVGALTPDAGTGVYHVAAGQIWNFDWSANVDVTGLSGATLDGFTYLLELDLDPGVAETFLAFDLINLPYADHALGNNSSVQAPGHPHVEANSADYLAELAVDNVAQNSWRHAFFPVPYDVNADGVYTVRLSVFDPAGGVSPLASSEIQVVVGAGAPVPEPATMTLLGLGLAGLGMRFRKRKNA